MTRRRGLTGVGWSTPPRTAAEHCGTAGAGQGDARERERNAMQARPKERRAKRSLMTIWLSPADLGGANWREDAAGDGG